MGKRYHIPLSAATGGCMGVLSFFVTDFLDVRDLDNMAAIPYFVIGAVIGLCALWYIQNKPFYITDTFRPWMLVFFIANLFLAYFTAYYGGVLGGYIIITITSFFNIFGTPEYEPFVIGPVPYLIAVFLFFFFLRWYVRGSIIFLEKKTGIRKLDSI